ncbi:MAG TPA: dihydrodipicolinate synthase family protein, partial [Chitinophagaceae bacterium]|nr:dihydrodipicolinate synthase family protein [Chitinophagaceae bacterium]
MKNAALNPDVEKLLQEGTVIPAHPLALKPELTIDEDRQRALTRYYLACGAGGLAVGVHTTQFEIRKPEFNLLETVLRFASEEIQEEAKKRPLIKVAGICGPTNQALKEAELALKYGYDLGLVSLGGLNTWSDAQLIEHMVSISEVIPVFGFYLQPSVGGRLLSFEYWRDFVEIPNVRAIKVAAFNRYQTLDVIRAVSLSKRSNEIALYTGNDDNIVADLLTTYRFDINGKSIEKRFVGGLLGHWAIWTKKAVELLNEIKQCIADNYSGVDKLMSKGIVVTDMNAVIFDAKNSYKGCIAGIHEVLRRQGLMEGVWCLSPEEKLSKGQMEEIDRIYKEYPAFTDDEFVKQFLAAEK